MRQEVKRRVAAAGESVAAAAKAIGVSRPTVYDWLANGDLRVSQLRKLAIASGEPFVLQLDAGPDQVKAPPPAWAEDLVTQDEVRRLVDEARAAVEDEIRANREAISRAGEVLRLLADLPALLSKYGPALERALQQLDAEDQASSEPTIPDTQETPEP